MRIFAVIAAILAVAASPAAAQTAPDAARQRQLDLAERYLTLTQGGDLLKQVRRQIEDGYGESGLPEEQRAWMTENMSDILEDVIEATIAELRDDVADSFTTAELEAAVAFYESPMGRSIVLKQVDMNADIQEVMAPLLIPRMTSLMEKFCQRFDCAALGAAAAKDFE